MNLEDAPFPEKPLVPVIPVVHDRVTIEIMRGCLNGCRFCSAGMIYRPQRYRTVDKVVELARKGYDATGYDTVNLLSLSSSGQSLTCSRWWRADRGVLGNRRGTVAAVLEGGRHAFRIA
ncbi:MAG: radical SAM protein [Planctomycetota bacterium]|nr:radical SAM protein [Planctomycetota bacterium]